MTVAQAAVVGELKEKYIKPEGLALSVDEFFPTRNQGSKEERIKVILQHRYDNKMMWHYRGGHCQTLEEELRQTKPPHDDIKDAFDYAGIVRDIQNALASRHFNLLEALAEAIAQ